MKGREVKDRLTRGSECGADPFLGNDKCGCEEKIEQERKEKEVKKLE